MSPMTMQRYKLYEGKGNDCLRLEEVERPVVKRPTDVLVKIHALSLNARDHQFTNGKYMIPIPEGGAVVTSDAAGEVVEVGSDVSLYKTGDRVIPIPMPGFHHSEFPGKSSIQRGIGFTDNGTASEYMIVDEEDLVTMPSHMTYEEGATLPIACGTAWTALYGAGKILKSGETVVCMGTGGVAVFTAAIALGAGARVIMTSSSDEKVEAVRKHLGNLVTSKDRLLSINRRKNPETDKEVARLTDGKLADILVEIGGIRTLPASIRSVKQGGLIAITGYLSDQQDEEGPTEDIAKLLLVHGPVARGILCCNREQMKQLHSAFEQTQFRPIIDRTFKFDQLKEAYDYAQSGDHLGKIVVKVSSD